MSVERCPVCFGRGTVESGFYNPPPPGWIIPTTTAIPSRETCRACGGRGVIITDVTYPGASNTKPRADDEDGAL